MESENHLHKTGKSFPSIISNIFACDSHHINNARSLAIYITVFSILAAPGAATAQTSNGDAPPKVQFVDENGVDMRSGQWVVNSGEISIGASGQPQLSHSFGAASLGAASGTPAGGFVSHPDCNNVSEAIIEQCSSDPDYFSLGDDTDFGRFEGRTISGYTVTDKDGTQYIYDDNIKMLRWTPKIYAALSKNSQANRSHYKFSLQRYGWIL